MSVRLALVLTLFATTAGCTGCTTKDDPEDESHIDVDYVDVGRACITGMQDQAHLISVGTGICLSSTCDELLDVSCSATLEGDTITIEAAATVRSRTGESVYCTADCGLVTAECQTPSLAPGTYTVTYGELSVELIVPSDASTCVGEL